MRGHDRVGTEHLLLGLINASGAAATTSGGDYHRSRQLDAGGIRLPFSPVPAIVAALVGGGAADRGRRAGYGTTTSRRPLRFVRCQAVSISLSGTLLQVERERPVLRPPHDLPADLPHHLRAESLGHPVDLDARRPRQSSLPSSTAPSSVVPGKDRGGHA
jgi:hypothetical protein